MLLLGLLLAVFARAEVDREFTSQVNYTVPPFEVLFRNFEQPRDKPYLIAHFRVRNPGHDEQRFPWRELIVLERADGTTLVSNYDVLVDSGGGLTRAHGDFLIQGRRRVDVSVLFMLAPGDLPGRLVLPDGRRSVLISPTGRARWNQ